MAIKAVKQSKTTNMAINAVPDKTPPTLTISSDTATLKAGETSTITFTFSEKIKGFTAADIDVSGGTLSALSGSGLIRTATFTPDVDNTLVGAISVAKGSYTDKAGNKGAVGNTVTLTGDTKAPTVTLSSDTASLKAGETSTITFTFSETIKNFAKGDIDVSGGTLSALNGSGLTRTATFTPDIDSTLTGAISVAEGSYTDKAGNKGAAGNTVTLTGDTAVPTVSLSSDTASLKAGETSMITFQFSEPVKGFSADDISVSGGTLSKLGGSGQTRTATFTPDADTNNLTGAISVAEGSYTDKAGNNGGGDAISLTGDTKAPSVIIQSDPATLKAGETSTITFQFSEAVKGFSADDITVSGGTLSKLGGSGQTRTATFTQNADATQPSTISVAEGSYTDKASNSGLGNSLALTGDTTAPTLAISSDTTTLKAGETAALTFTFSEATKGFTANDISISGGTLGELSGTGLTRTATFTPTADTNSLTGTISVAEGSYTDKAGNSGLGNTISLTGDTAAPTLIISSDKATLKAGETANLTFSFSEAVKDFVADDISVSGGTLGELSGSGLTRTATFTRNADATQPGAISVAEGSYTDKVGNSGLGNSLTLTGDTTAPTLAISSDKATLKAGETANLTFSFSEATKDFGADDISVSGGTLSELSGAGLTRTATFTPTADTNNLTGAISVAKDSYTDKAGNSGLGSTLSLTGDTAAPSLVISSDKATLKAGESAALTFSFSEETKGFAAADIAVSDGTLSELSGAGLTRTATFTPTANINNLAGAISVAKDSYTDKAGNSGIGSTLSLTGDTAAPSLVISSDKTTLKAGESAALTFSFSEETKDFAAADIAVSGGTLSELSGTGLTRTATFTPTANINNLSGAISVAKGSYTDNAGNSGAAGNTITLTGDILAPTLTISSGITALKTGGTAGIEFDFSEAPVGFTASDVVVTGGTLTAPTVSALNTHYTAFFTPTPNNTGNATITVAAGAYTDAAGNNGGANTPFSLPFDTLAPTLAISSSKTVFKAGETAPVTFTFSEIPTGFTASDITVTGGSLSGLAASPTDAKLYTATFAPTANTNSLTGAISVAASSYTDAAGNNGAASNNLALTGDTLAPTLAISSNKTVFKVGETATVSFNFSEAPTGFTASDITASGGALSNLTAAADGKTYTATFAPTVDANSLTGAISVAASSYTDTAGNKGAASNSLSLTGDTQAPTVTIGSDKTSFKAGETATVTFTFNEAPTGFTAADVTVTGGSLGSLIVNPTDSKVYTALFTPTANTNSLTGAISVAAGTYTDTAGNNATLSNSLALTGDTLAPTLAITSSSSSLSAGQTATLTFTFSEAPTGFDASDISVVGGSLGTLSVAELIRTAIFTPTANASGAASISVASGLYTDAAGNLGGAGTTPSVNYNTVVVDNTPTPTPSGPTSQSLDALTGSQQTPATFNAGTAAFALTDAIGAASFVRVTGFGANDSIAITGGGSNHLIVANDGSDVLFTVNNGGIVSQITLVGVASASQIIGDLSAFNALSVGDASYS